ncbi:MAG: hypothetical protein KC457_02330 [Myxococcales bacterium]|nr:hypothetical protein [Myxococcales bacterium]
MQTLELRWFVAGALPEGALEAFTGGSGGRGFAGASGVFAGVSATMVSDSVEERADRYLLGTGEERGIKRRGDQGPFEDKRLEEVDGGILEVPGMAPIPADVERWSKSILSASALPGEPRWVTVHKRRALRWLDHGRAELTSLRIDGKDLVAAGLYSPEGLEFHTLALECTTGRGSGSGERLRASAVRLLDQGEALWRGIADEGECWSYPAWLTWSLHPK